MNPNVTYEKFEQVKITLWLACSNFFIKITDRVWNLKSEIKTFSYKKTNPQKKEMEYRHQVKIFLIKGVLQKEKPKQMEAIKFIEHA